MHRGWGDLFEAIGTRSKKRWKKITLLLNRYSSLFSRIFVRSRPVLSNHRRFETCGWFISGILLTVTSYVFCRTHWQRTGAAFKVVSGEVFFYFCYPSREPKPRLRSLLVKNHNDSHEFDQFFSKCIQSMDKNEGGEEWSVKIASDSCINPK